MACVVPRRGGNWEIRESLSTPAGPRSRTLATFKTLTAEVISHAQTRASRPLQPSRLRQAAHRAGAPVAPGTGDRAAAELISELSAGRRPRPEIERLLLESLQGARDPASDNARAATAWIGVSPQKRGDTLRELLLLADQFPRRKRPQRPKFPRIQSRPA
ncbi:MAG: hypothetical protein ACRDK4_06100 [Solirubrobacteraceae bacterium]